MRGFSTRGLHEIRGRVQSAFCRYGTPGGGKMQRRWIFRVVTVGLVSGLLFGTVAQGQAEPKVKSVDVARGKTLFVRNCAGCHGSQGKGDGYRLLGPDPA